MTASLPFAVTLLGFQFPMKNKEEEKKEILRHSLGHTGYRNYFAAGEGNDDWTLIQEMVSEGLMQRGRTIPGGLIYFHVTQKGCELVKIKPKET